MAICTLSEREAQVYELHGKLPSCYHHGHISNRKAERLVADQAARWMQDLRGRIVVYAPRVWKVRAMSLQLVRGVIQGRAGHFVTPGIEARGARGRMSSAFAINHVPDYLKRSPIPAAVPLDSFHDATPDDTGVDAQRPGVTRRSTR